MNQLNDVLDQIRQASSNNLEVAELTDTINMEMSSNFSEIILLIQESHRAENVEFTPNNAIIHHNGAKIVFLSTRVLNSGSLRAYGGYGIAWNLGNSLNLWKPVPSCHVTHDSAAASALLAIAVQCNELSIKKVCIPTQCPYVKRILRNIDTIRATDNELPNSQIFSALSDAMQTVEIMVIDTIHNYSSVLKEAKNLAGKGAEVMRQNVARRLM